MPPHRETDMSAITAAQKIARIQALAQGQFIARSEAIEVIAIALACGEHAILLGPPGTGKSSVIRFFSDQTGLSFFRKLLNPDTTRDELVGPIDPAKFDQGIWDRRWSGMATHQVVLLDEVGKASSQVVNMTLDAMEERLVTSGDVDRRIPLHCLFGASNESLGDDLAAAWDRFTLRIRLKPLASASDIVKMITRHKVSVAPAPIAENELTAYDVEDLRSAAKRMAQQPSEEVCQALAKLFSGIGNVTSVPVSDRRWERVLLAGAGRALLYGRSEIALGDLIVAQHMLWGDTDDIEAVARFVVSVVDVESAALETMNTLVDELRRRLAQSITIEENARVKLQAVKLQKSLPAVTARVNDWAQIRKSLADLTNLVRS